MDSGSDSRKRPLDSDGDDGMTKRPATSDASSRDDVHFKMLVPSNAAGAVIGKAGETIGKLQRETGAKMKMSKNQDVFPGTNERICLIVGNIHSCQAAHDEVSFIILDKPDLHPKPNSEGDKSNFQRHQQTRFLIPNTTAGVIIGKGGAYIKEIKERTGAHVNVSHKGDNPERIVTVSSADRDEVRAAIGMILEKLAQDPQSGSYPSLTYTHITNSNNLATPSGSFTNLTNSGGMNMGSMGGGAMTPHQVQQAAQSLNSMMRNFGTLGGGSVAARQRSPILDQLVQTLKLTGYTDLASEEIAMALGTLANYGVLSLTGGSLLGNLMNLNRLSLHSSANGSGAANGVAATSSSSATNQSSAITPLLNSTSSSARTDSGVANEDSVSLLRQLTDTLNRNRTASSSGMVSSDYYSSQGKEQQDGIYSSGALFGVEGSSMGGYGAGSQGQAAGSPEPQETEEIQVAENMAGAIIGQQGQGIKEINQLTGATVSVSRRGVYAPGTNNRIVTIQGAGSAVSRAALVVRHKIQEAENRRSSSSY